MNRLLTAFIGNNVLANVVLLAIVSVGILATTGMVREDMPEIDLKAIEITVALPGADPEEVEVGISRRIEAAIDGLEGIRAYHTRSFEGMATAYIEIREGYDNEAVKDRVEEAIDGISTFPKGTERPQITIDRISEEVLTLMLWGDLPERQLKQWAEATRAELQALPEVSLVDVYATRDYEIDIEVPRAKLIEHSLTLSGVARAIQAASENQSAGSVKSEGEEIRIRTLGRRYDGRDFAAIVVKSSASGERITLDRLGVVKDGFSEDPAYARFNGHPCVPIEVSNAPGEDSIRVSKAVRAYAAKKQTTLPPGVHLTPCFDESEFISDQIDMLVTNGLLGLLLVLAILWLFLNTRLSFWVAMGIPISLAGAMIVLWVIGASINQVSLIAFIIVLGIIVDDAIVVGEAIYYHRSRGEDPLHAAIHGVREVGVPVVAAVTTTMVAFIPMALVPGFMGQMMGIAPTVVIAALAVSLIESLFLLPAHLNHLPVPPVDAPGAVGRLSRWRSTPRRWLGRFAENIYLPTARKAVKHRYVTAAIAISILMVTTGLVGGELVRIDFWPPADGTYLAATVEFPQGSPPEVTRNALAQTQAAIERVAARTKTTSGKPLLRNVHTRVYQRSPYRGQILFEMIKPSERGIHSQDISAEWEKEVGPIPGAVAQTFYKESIGMGGPPIEIWLQAKEIGDLRAAAEELKAKLRTYDGVYQIRDDFRPGKTEFQVKLRPEAHSLGLTLDDVSRHLRAGYYGEEALRFQRGRDDVIVRVRYPEDERRNLADLRKDRIQTPQGFEIPLLSVAEVTVGQGYSTISGTNGLRRTVVMASVDATKNTPRKILTELEAEYFGSIEARYSGMTCSIHGAAESNAETWGGIKRGFVIAVLGVFVIMATTFRSYLQPFVILLLIPFGLVGAIVGHGLLGIPITFLSLFGILALTGIVVNDAIVLIECANTLLAQGMPLHEALCRAGVRRFRAIFLTTASTCAGLFPLIMEKDLQAQMVIPMAASIAFGLAFATVVTLIFIPAAITILNDLRRLFHRLITKRWPTPEEVEPATLCATRQRRRSEAVGKAILTSQPLT